MTATPSHSDSGSSPAPAGSATLSTLPATMATGNAPARISLFEGNRMSPGSPPTTGASTSGWRLPMSGTPACRPSSRNMAKPWTRKKPTPWIHDRRARAKARGRLYRQLAKEFLLNNPRCRRCQSLGEYVRADQVHHLRGRLAALLLDTRYFIPLCQRCHSFVHAHPNSARESGLLCELGQWNKP